MKKFYFLLTVGLLILSVIFISYYTGSIEKQFFNEEFTPEEIWQKQFQEKKAKRKHGYSKADKPNMFSKYFKDITTRIGESESGYQMNYKTKELQNARDNASSLKSRREPLEFVQRGPANVGGRTRAIVVDPDVSDKNTWYAGSASGGIWKTTDGAENWTNLSNDLTNLSVNALFMAPSNHDVIYAGTGESFPGSANNLGNGIWKSENRGDSWTQMDNTKTDERFAYVNRLWVNPTNANIVLAATEYGIYKSINGGGDWIEVYKSYSGVEDMKAHPSEENIIYAGENSKGVLRTLDGGDTWKLASEGLVKGGRYELSVSPVNKDVVYTSINVSDHKSFVYVSRNGGAFWYAYKDEDNNPKNENFLGGQGNYDNVITAHPFNENEAYVAGVNMWKVTLNETVTVTGEGAVEKAYTENTDFLSFINFKGDYLDGGLSTEEGTGLLATDWSSVEIRFGAGYSQKAHRFTVPDEATGGVSASNYTYSGYVDVPFQVWDTKNDRQLMVSFRDQEKDGAFNLYTRTGEDYGELGREYIYVNAVEYNANAADVSIAISGGHRHKAMYMIWPTLRSGASWDAENLPTSKIVVKYAAVKVFGGTTTSVADAYGEYGGGNNYDQGAGFGDTKIPGLHPDHHNITIIPLDDTNFRIINGNDGGIGVSEDNGITFNQRPNNYITTQFYGVAKNPEANEYIGGMQDNGTWQSAAREDASSKTNYYFRLGGDGFECLWHGTDSKKLLGSIYYNAIYKTTNGGKSWSGVNGITKDDGPFITRLSSSKSHPDVVFAVGGSGVYKSTDFGSNWEMKRIESNWSNGSAYSVHNVEVSLADPKIVWAGAAMQKGGLKIHVSQDEGEIYTSVNDYTEKNINAYISGIATHPTEPNTAYLLYSIAEGPKILRTTDLGQNWKDISGFGTTKKSNNGFPDVVTHCLLVMPNSPETIWAGTEIGLFESTDNGESWHMLSGNLPPVSIYDMHFVGNQVVIATHGRGIWSVDIPEINRMPVVSEFREIRDRVIQLDVDINDVYDYMEIYINDKVFETIQAPVQGSFSHEITVDEAGVYNSYVIAYVGKEPLKSNQKEVEVKDKRPIINRFELIKYNKLRLQLEISVEYDEFKIYINGSVFKTIDDFDLGNYNYEMLVEEAGIYSAQVIGYMFDSEFKSNTERVEVIATGIETVQEDLNEMMIYPNPCRGVFKLQLDNSSQDFILEIFDLSGKKVYSENGKNTGTNTILIEPLPAGFYIVRVTMGDKVRSRKIQVI